MTVVHKVSLDKLKEKVEAHLKNELDIVEGAWIEKFNSFREKRDN